MAHTAGRPCQLSSNPQPASIAYVSFSRTLSSESYGGSLSRFMQVAEVGSLPCSWALWMQKAGVIHAKPSWLGQGQG